MTDPNARENYLLEEYKALRSEMEHHLKSVVAIQSSAVAGIGAIIVLGSHTSRFAAPGLVVLAALAALPHYFRVQSIGKYIRTLEEKFLLNGEGYQFFLSNKESSPLYKFPFLLFIGIGWTALFLFAALMPYLKG